MRQKWTIADFLDLEYFFMQDQKLTKEGGERVLRERDRALFLDEIKPEVGEAVPDRGWLIFRWLQVRRSRENQAHSEVLLPGQAWSGFKNLLSLLVSLLMVISGAGIAYSALSYFGKEPVNVSIFFLFFVVVQLLWLALILMGWAVRQFKGQDLRSAYGPSLLNRVIVSLLKPSKLASGGGRRARLAALMAGAQARSASYKRLFLWPPFILLQISGVAFNLGVLGALLVKVLFTDLAFGWQSTIALTAPLVSTFVKWLALPWSWLLGSFAYPGLAQIEGSRMVLKEGMYHLVNADLTSWWPFLLMAIFCYGLLPRVLLLGAGVFGVRRALSRDFWKRVEYLQLVQRMLTPLLETGACNRGAVEARPTSFLTSALDNLNGVSQAGEIREPALHGSLIALIPDELFGDCDLQKLDFFCRQAYGYEVKQSLCLAGEESEPNLIFKILEMPTGVLLLQEAWQPPIQEMMTFLQKLRTSCRVETHIIIALVGKPEPETIFTPVVENDLRIWQQKLAILGDLYLQVSPLVFK